MTVSRKHMILGAAAIAAAAMVGVLLIPARTKATAATAPAREPGMPPRLRLSVTNGTTRDYAFYFYLQVRTESGWSEAPNQSEHAGVLQFFVKGRAEHIEMERPAKAGLYRFECGYEPLEGTAQSMIVYNWLHGLKLPGALGTGYRRLLGRFQPWPKKFFSNVFEVEADAPPGVATNAGQSD